MQKQKSMFGKKDIEFVFLALMTNQISLSFVKVAIESFSIRIARKLYMTLEKAISIISDKNGAKRVKSRRLHAYVVAKKFPFTNYGNFKIENGICEESFAVSAFRN